MNYLKNKSHILYVRLHFRKNQNGWSIPIVIGETDIDINRILPNEACRLEHSTYANFKEQLAECSFTPIETDNTKKISSGTYVGHSLHDTTIDFKFRVKVEPKYLVPNFAEALTVYDFIK